MNSYTLKVVEIRHETPDTLTLCFKQPALRKIKYVAGQYLTLIFKINGRRYLRPYSFSSSPLIDPLLEITIKRVLNGVVSNHIHDKVSIGDSIEVLPPMGVFTYDKQKSYKSIYLWGIGSGITPLISIAKDILASESDVKVVLVYGNKNFESTIFLNQINDLADKFEGRFFAKHFHTKFAINEINPSVIEGRIDLQKALMFLSGQDGLQNTGHYICGPSGLKESVKTALKRKNISLENIFSEDFELVRDPNDFADIYTQNISLTFNRVVHHVEVAKGKSILEAALDAGIEIPYSCQTGNCSTCKGNLITGKIKMIGINTERFDLRPDEYLLCCTHPLNNNVSIEIKN